MTALGSERLYREETGSTMDDALQAGRDGYGPGTVCWSSYQRQGRGRLAGRAWESRPGESLMMTLLLHSSLLDLRPTLSLRIGLAAALYLEQRHGLFPRIKWPNDIFAEGRKLCGILCEYREGVLLAGLGLNLNQREFPPELPRAGSVRMITGRVSDPAEELEGILPFLDEVLRGNPPLEEWNRRLLFRNERITLRSGAPGKGEILAGTLSGLNPDGSLRLNCDGMGADKDIYSGEIVIS